MIPTSQGVVNEKKHHLSMLIDENLRSVIAISFLKGIIRYLMIACSFSEMLRTRQDGLNKSSKISCIQLFDQKYSLAKNTIVVHDRAQSNDGVPIVKEYYELQRLN